MTPDITVVIGPTAIGKSDYAVQLALETGAHILSADAFQIYRHLDIGTAKPSLAQRQAVPHHLIDELEPTEPYSVAHFLEKTAALISTLRQARKPIVICGGTGLYLQAFLNQYTLSPTPTHDPAIRKELEIEAAMNGEQALWERLQQLDPDAASAIHPQNLKRVMRALEFFTLTGTQISQAQPKTQQQRDDVRLIGLTADRPIVVDRIEKRIDAMMAEGLVQEVETLLKTYPPTLNAFEAIGYKETIAYLHGDIGYQEMLDWIKARTRQFSKRQMTWFKRFNHVHWIRIS
ncbi:MAG: tRNA (adenosine(37)-N6)-dimethylallyltransferase MiaA [Candidatus Margulisiibacteriota bacterium]